VATTKSASETSRSKPTEKQRELLKALAGARRVAVVATEGRKKAHIETFKGKPVKVDFPVKRELVEGCCKKGWLELQRFKIENGGLDGIDHYTITEAGVAARKAR